MANLQGVMVTFILAQALWPITYVSNFDIILENPTLELGFSLIFLSSLLLTVYKLLPRDANVAKGVIRQRNFLYYICCLFAITSTFSLMIALETFEYIDGFVDFYLENSEPYLASSFGIADSIWDATVRFALYLTIIYKFDNGHDYTRPTLYWIGDMMYGLLCIFLGAFTGIYGDGVTISVVFNGLYFLPPVFALKHVLQVQSDRKSADIGSSQGHTFKMTDGILSIALVFSAVLGFIKGVAALGSPTAVMQYYVHEFEPYIMEPGKFGAVHCVLWLVYLVPVQIICAYCLIRRESGKTAETLAILLAGAITRSSVSHLFSLVSNFTAIEYRATKNIGAVVLLNLFPVMISHLLMWKLDTGKAAATFLARKGQKIN